MKGSPPPLFVLFATLILAAVLMVTHRKGGGVSNAAASAAQPTLSEVCDPITFTSDPRTVSHGTVMVFEAQSPIKKLIIPTGSGDIEINLETAEVLLPTGMPTSIAARHFWRAVQHLTN